MTKIELTEKLAKETNGKLWVKKDEELDIIIIARVYYKKGYAEIKDGDSIFFETVYRTNFEDVKQFAIDNNLKRVYS